MASAGMLTVTNAFENKTAEALMAISANLITAEPSIQMIAAGLIEAAEGAEDVERRSRGSDALAGRGGLDSSFGDALLTRVLSLLVS